MVTPTRHEQPIIDPAYTNMMMVIREAGKTPAYQLDSRASNRSFDPRCFYERSQKVDFTNLDEATIYFEFKPGPKVS